jgi:hypothetical protein
MSASFLWPAAAPRFLHSSDLPEILHPTQPGTRWACAPGRTCSAFSAATISSAARTPIPREWPRRPDIGSRFRCKAEARRARRYINCMPIPADRQHLQHVREYGERTGTNRQRFPIEPPAGIGSAARPHHRLHAHGKLLWGRIRVLWGNQLEHFGNAPVLGSVHGAS